MISPRVSSTRGDLGAETLRRELLAADPPKLPAASAKRCGDCAHSGRCKMLLGPSYSANGPCDWSPTRFTAAPEPTDPTSGKGAANSESEEPCP